MPKCPKCGSVAEMFCAGCKIPTERTKLDAAKEIAAIILGFGIFFLAIAIGFIRAILGIAGIIYSSRKLNELWKKQEENNKDAFLKFAMLFLFSLFLIASTIHHDLKHGYAEDFCEYIKDYAHEAVCYDLLENDFARETCYDSFRELNCNDLLESFKEHNAYNDADYYE